MISNTFRNLCNFVTFKPTFDLNKSQWWTIEQLEEFQNKRLKEIILYVYKYIPGYRKKMDSVNIRPGDIKSKSDLWKIPVTTREELQNNKDFYNSKLISGTLFTGGSTGAPLKYFESMESGIIRMKAHLRGWSWNGYVPGRKLAVICSGQGNVKNNNTINLTGDLTAENIKDNIRILLDFKPQHLRGYVSSLYILAKYCIDNEIKIDGIKSINPISENLYDFQRFFMEKAFNCKVFEEYCCNDGGACAWECGHHNGLHYVMERAIIEDLNGEILVTDLWNKAMPFIRYKNGDSVLFLEKKCSCGRNLPLIKVKGRTNDMLISKAGPISPTYIMHSWYDGTKIDENKDYRIGFRAVQYIQKKSFFVVVNIVKNGNCNEKMIVNFEEQLIKILHGMTYKLNFVKTIQTTEKGKRNFIINEDKELLKQYERSFS